MEAIREVTGQELEARVRLYCEVAKANGALLSVSELLALLPEHGSEAELERAIRASPDLDAAYELKSGFIVERSVSGPLETSERASRLRARSNLAHAESVVPLLRGRELLLLGVSGSSSYRSAARSVDLDFYSVVRKGTLWVFLTKALILSRAIRLLRARSPEICLSCSMDEETAEESFAYPRGSLYARDALSMIVVAGRGYYSRLLMTGSWISRFYPKLYASRLGAGDGSSVPEGRSTVAQRVVNRFLYFTVGTYIRAKSKLHNGLLAKQGRFDSIFTLLIGEGICVYESARYSRMREMYDSLGGA